MAAAINRARGECKIAVSKPSIVLPSRIEPRHRRQSASRQPTRAPAIVQPSAASTISSRPASQGRSEGKAHSRHPSQQERIDTARSQRHGQESPHAQLRCPQPRLQGPGRQPLFLVHPVWRRRHPVRGRRRHQGNERNAPRAMPSSASSRFPRPKACLERRPPGWRNCTRPPPYFRLEADLAIRSRKPTLVYIDQRYRRFFRLPKSFHIEGSTRRRSSRRRVAVAAQVREGEPGVLPGSRRPQGLRPHAHGRGRSAQRDDHRR